MARPHEIREGMSAFVDQPQGRERSSSTRTTSAADQEEVVDSSLASENYGVKVLPEPELMKIVRAIWRSRVR